MITGEAVFLTENDLQEYAIDKPMGKLSIFDFRTERQTFEKAAFVVYSHNGESKVLKSRYTAVGKIRG